MFVSGRAKIVCGKIKFEPFIRLRPTSDGSAAAIVCSENFLRTHPHLKKQAVEILGMKMATDFPSTFEENSNLKMVNETEIKENFILIIKNLNDNFYQIGYDVAKHAAEALYKEVGFGPEHAQVIELHDCFSANELITYEALGLCAPGIQKCRQILKLYLN